MKINKIMIVCILLAILTIGAVSASDNATQNDAAVALGDSSDDLTGESYSDDDFYITVQENYTHDKTDWNSNDLIYISSYSKDNATLSISVDDVEKQSLKITNGYFSIEDDGYGGTYEKYFKQIYPADLGMDLGKYNVKVKYNQKTLIDTSVSLNEKDDFDIFMQNPYYCEGEYWSSPSFIAIDSNHNNTGTLEILVNGVKKASYAVNRGSFEEIADCSNKSRYLAASDLLSDYGTYDIKITFTENGTARTLKNEKVTVAEFEPTADPKLELYFDLYTVNIPADNIAHIYLPREATGKLTISYNDVVNKTVDYSKGQATHYINSWELNHLGENTITVTYTGDDFGTLTATEKVIVVPTITCPFMVSSGEQFMIGMITHDWVNGEFRVYDYNEGKKGKLLASDTIYSRKTYEGATSIVTLSSDTVGLNRFYLEFDYLGGDYPLIQEVHVIENSHNITVFVQSEIETGKNATITFKAPESPFTFVYISVDGKTPDYYMVENGELTTAISALPAGYHEVTVEYNDGNYVDGKWVGEVYHNTFKVNSGTKTAIETGDVTVDYNSGGNLVVTLKDNEGKALANKEIIVTMAGSERNETTNDKGQASFAIDMDAGNYTADILFNGDNGYLSSSASAKVVVNKISTVLTADNVTAVYDSASTLTISLKDVNGVALSDMEISVNLNGSASKLKTDFIGMVSLPLILDSGEYVANIKFNGDDNYKASSATAKVSINRAATQLTAPAITATYNVAKKLTVTLKDEKGSPLAGQNIIVKLNNKVYSNTTDSDGRISVSVSLPAKSYVADITFSGSDNYNPSNQTAKVTVKKATPKLTASSKTFKAKAKTKKVTATLKNNKNKPIKKATVKLTVNKKTYTAKTNSKGVATFKVKLTKKAKYTAVFKYSSSNYKTVTKKVKITIK